MEVCLKWWHVPEAHLTGSPSGEGVGQRPQGGDWHEAAWLEQSEEEGERPQMGGGEDRPCSTF